MIPRVVASESGVAQTVAVEAVTGLYDHDIARQQPSGTAWKGRP